MQIITKTNQKLKSKFQSIFKHKGFKKFIVLSRSRTGSNMLISFLNAHPNIQAEGEIFAKLGGKDPNNILSEVFAKQPLYIKARGFKIFYYHPLDEKDKSNELWNALINMDNLQVIHLKRRNLLRTLVSRKIAGLQDVWAVRDYDQSGIEQGKNCTFTVEELSEGFQKTREWEKMGEKNFKDHPIISVYYEDLLKDKEANYAKIIEFLGLNQDINPRTNLKKQNPESLRKLVKNYDYLKEAFVGTKWHDFFEE